MFNTCFELVIDSLNLFEWIGESVNSNDKIEQILFKFSKHPSILKIKQKVYLNLKPKLRTLGILIADV